MKETANDAAVRAALIAYISTTDWNGPSVLAQCENCPLDGLRQFAKALKNGTDPVPMGFRWAQDDDSGNWLQIVEQPK